MALSRQASVRPVERTLVVLAHERNTFRNQRPQRHLYKDVQGNRSSVEALLQ